MLVSITCPNGYYFKVNFSFLKFMHTRGIEPIRSFTYRTCDMIASTNYYEYCHLAVALLFRCAQLDVKLVIGANV